MIDPLSAFFDPRSIAVVGASDDPAKWGHIVAKQSLRNSDRQVFFVNSRATTVLGRHAHSSLRDIGEHVDLAVVAVPVGAFSAVIDDAIASGVSAVLAITAGFAELGTDGEELQRSCVDRLRRHGIRLIGPNCLGLADNHSGVHLAANEFASGSVALLSQSGNIALELDSLFREAGLGVSRFISIGNQADVGLVELMDSCSADPATVMLALYVEDFLDGRAFIAAAQRAHAAGKPVVVLASGGGPAAVRSAGSHTGALSSSTDIVRMACELAGAVFVRTPREMVTALQSVHHRSDTSPREVGVVTDGGGHGTMAAGLLESAGFSVPLLDESQQARLRARLWSPSSVTNPVDLAGFGEQDPSSYADCIRMLLGDLDAVLLTGYFGGYSSPTPFAGGLADGEVAAAKAIARAVAETGRPVVVHSMARTSLALDVLRQAGIPVFHAVEDAVDALRHLRAVTVQVCLPLPEVLAPLSSAGYVELRECLRTAGLPSGRVVEVTDEAGLQAACDGLQPPYVLKTAALVHKSDAGGVVLGLEDVDALRKAYANMAAALGSVRASVESMVSMTGAVELIVGLTRDPRFGPVLTLGAGGVLTEMVQDVVRACAPVDAAQAFAMLNSLRIAPLFNGYRGLPRLDLRAAAEAVAGISRLAAAHAEWREFEVNPLAVTAEGAHILDARAYC